MKHNNSATALHCFASASLAHSDLHFNVKCSFFDAQLNTTHSLPWVWSLDERLFWNKCDTVLNCEENSILGNGLPQRADLEHQCLALKLLSIKVHPCSIFSTIWANNNDDGKPKDRPPVNQFTANSMLSLKGV